MTILFRLPGARIQQDVCFAGQHALRRGRLYMRVADIRPLHLLPVAQRQLTLLSAHRLLLARSTCLPVFLLLSLLLFLPCLWGTDSS